MNVAVHTTYLHAHQFAALAPGPRLIVTGAVHGNETCGTQAIRRTLDDIQCGRLEIEHGLLTLLPVANPYAYAKKERQGDRNLNRNLRPGNAAGDYEDRVANVLCPWLDAHEVLLDLHSFHTGGQPFAMLGPRNNAGSLESFSHERQEERLVAHLGARCVVEGWMQAYERGVERRRRERPGAPVELLDAAYGVGTAEYMRSRGGYGTTLECGQHDDPHAPEFAYQAIRQTLALLGMARIPLQPPPPGFTVYHLEDVVDMDHAGDTLVKPWASFDPVARGEPIGQRHDGTLVRAERDGFVVFPNPRALPGNEWFYFAVRSSRTLDAESARGTGA